MSMPVTTSLYIQRLVHLVNSDATQSETTLKKIDDLSAAYARDKFVNLSEPDRRKKLLKIDKAVDKQVHTSLRYSACEAVRKGLAEPKLQAIRDQRLEASRKAAADRAEAAQRALAQRQAAQKAAEAARAASRPATLRMNTQDSGWLQQQARATEARERALNEREQTLNTRDQELQEQQLLLDAQVASLSQWEADLNAQRNALAELNNSGPLNRHQTD
jgi:hypothetical protein